MLLELGVSFKSSQTAHVGRHFHKHLISTKRMFISLNLVEEAYYKKHNFRFKIIHNVNETGLYNFQIRITYVIGRRGKRQIATLTSAERGYSITIIVCKSASGH